VTSRPCTVGHGRLERAEPIVSALSSNGGTQSVTVPKRSGPGRRGAESRRTPRWFRPAVLVSSAVLAVVVSSCSSSSSQSSSTTTSSAVTSTTMASAAPAAATAAINAYETTNGPATGTWQITSTQVSTVDPSYILFRIGATPGHQDSVQGGYGFVRNKSGTWSVIGFGSAEVGCPPGSTQTPVVPSAVLGGFGLACPPSS
jgi:hypothetical protein